MWLLLTWTHLCWSLLLILSIAKFLREPILKNICKRFLLKMCSWNWEKLFIRSFNFTLKNRFFEHQYQKQVYDWYFVFGFLWRFLWCGEKQTPITKYLELIKRRSKVEEKNTSCERALNFDLWKIFSEKYKPMRVWFWLAYKFTENYCRSLPFFEFMQTQKRYPISLDKIRILTWKLLVISN